MRKSREVVASVFARPAPKRAVAAIASIVIVRLACGAAPAAAQGMFTVTSSDLRDGARVGNAQVYNQDECKGGNASPQLSWRNAPVGTKSFAVTVFDLDAPGPGWWHWAVADIPNTIESLPSNASASGYLKRIGAIEARNDYDDVGYGGPCPPPGKPHRYVVTVFALNTADLRLGPARHALMFDHEINTSVLAKAHITVTYGR
ncbi:YbhB/YbcL family Raf kinase inhibitor-like protein [Trinickia sp.]|uniref:YbhB/YbcL family Raf kinase inhibitor-like protein n=1 Tax=Trinickia sp. TaxID=2571163 RepID=UPI003F80F03E